MDYADKKYIVKKLMHDTLTEEERIGLQASLRVTDQMFSQWDNAPDAVRTDHPDESAIWRNICKGSWQSVSTQMIVFYKIYSVAASILLLLGIAGVTGYWILSEKNVLMYVVSSGIRNMESVSLPDGTKVQMGPGSKLTYPASFEGKTREVVLNGQAFFDVANNPHKPFIVHTGEMHVQALGTAFELFCYDVENVSEVILLHGKIKVNNYFVLPNQKLVIDKKNGTVTKWKVDADQYTAWRKQRTLSFENEKLSMIIPRLEQWYGRKIMCQKDLSEKYRFTFKVRDETLERILFMIEESSPLKHAKMENENYMITLK